MQNRIKTVLIILTIFLLRCGSSDPARFYLLKSAGCDQNNKINLIPDSVKIGIGPIKIPDYLQRPAIALYNSENEIIYSEFDRWAEPFDINLSRIFRENLSCELGSFNLHNYPWWNPKVITHQLNLEIVNFEVAADSSLNLKVFWQLSDFREGKIIKRGVFKKSYKVTGFDYGNIVKTKSAAVADLSSTLSDEIVTFIK